jgi:hypothetical protein
MVQQSEEKSLLISSFDIPRRPIERKSRRIKYNTALRRWSGSRSDKAVSVDSIRTFLPMPTAIMPGMSLRS